MEFRRVLFRSSSAFDPSVLRAWPIRRRDRAFGAAPIEDCLAVSGRNQLHTVIGGIHHGVRIDVAGSRAALPVERLIFPITTADARKDRKSTRLNSSHYCASRMPSSA